MLPHPVLGPVPARGALQRRRLAAVQQRKPARRGVPSRRAV